MKLKIWLVTFSAAILVALLYLDVDFRFGGETIDPPSIVIVVKPSDYEINGRKGADLIPFLSEEYKINDAKDPPNVIVSADSSIQYDRVVETMNTLKYNGYTKVGLVNTN